MNRFLSLARRSLVFVIALATLIALIEMPRYLPTALLDRLGVGPSTEVTTNSNKGSVEVTTSERVAPAKTAWDWAELLLVPLVLAVGGYWLTRNENQRLLLLEERREAEARIIEAHRIKDAVLRGYLDEMTKLLLENGLRESDPDDKVRTIARARTLATLRVLNAERKAILIQFLYESELITASKPPQGFVGNQRVAGDPWPDRLSRLTTEAVVGALQKIGAAGETVRVRSEMPRTEVGAVVDLSGADLTGINLEGFDLDGVALFGTDLRKASFARSNLGGATFVQANLAGADFTGSDLSAADMMGANLDGATFTGADLYEVDFCGADLEKAIVERNALGQALLYPTQHKIGNTWRGLVLTESGFWERIRDEEGNLSREFPPKEG